MGNLITETAMSGRSRDELNSDNTFSVLGKKNGLVENIEAMKKSLFSPDYALNTKNKEQWLNATIATSSV